MSDALEVARDALAGAPAWIVGGVPRDARLGRGRGEDVDLVIDGDPRTAARAIARAGRGTAFELSDAFGHWRVVGAREAWQVDIAPLAGPTIEADLAQRDFTINAIAEPLAGGAPVDSTGGLADLAAGLLRMTSAQAFDEDPLRVLRLARFACELDLDVDPETLTAARERAPRLEAIAQERAFAELKRIVSADDALGGLELMEATAAMPVVLPELAALHGVEQSSYHHLDVYDHTLAVLTATIELERDQEPLGVHATTVGERLAEPLADGLTRWQALRFGALMHDVAKPLTRTVLPNGRVGFPHHDAQGAELVRTALRRLRASERLIQHVAGLARHHLRLGFLVHRRPLDRRAVYDYLRACEPVELDVTVLSVADRLATRGRRAEEAIPKHLKLARELLGDVIAWPEHRAEPPLVRGDELAEALGIATGPAIGRLLEAIDEARYAGEVASSAEAIELARSLLVVD